MGKLQLNEPETYRSFEDEGKRYVDQMPVLVASGRTPASMADIIKQRVVTSGDIQRNWKFNYFDAGDGVAYHTDGSFKVVPDSQHLRTVNPQTRLVNGSLSLDWDVYNSLQGTSFSKKDREKLTGKWLTEKEAKKNPIWLAFTRENQELLDKYASEVFKYLKDNHNVTEGMGVFLPNAQDVPSLRAWLLGRFGYLIDSRSGAGGDCSLVNYCARLVGVGAGGAVEVPRSGSPDKGVVTPSLEQVLAVTNNFVAPVTAGQLKENLQKLYQK